LSCVTGVQTCALPISPKPQNPFSSREKVLKIIIAGFIYK